MAKNPTRKRVLTDESAYLKITTPLDGGQRKFVLTEVDGRESLSEPFLYFLTMRTKDPSISFDGILDQAVTVSIEMYNTQKRYINGIVTRFIQGDNDGEIITYNAEIRPWLWKLSLTSNSKIYQEMSVKDIILDVFSSLGFTDYSDKCTGTYSPKEYVVWYQESALNFVSRLMESAGIFYYFEHTDSKHTMVLADASSVHEPTPHLTQARFVETDQKYDDLIEDCFLEEQVIPNAYAVEDYFFETPDTDLLTQADGNVSGNLRHYEYPAKYTTTGDGEAIANRRMEIHELPKKLLRGEGLCRAFIAGYKFTLSEHYRQDLNTDWVIQDLAIHATQRSYTNRFLSFPATVPFRPPRKTRKPRIHGSQTALVVGKSGEEIWPDQYGRIKVQFYWDQEGAKDENSSCWIRVGQIWAGKNWGTLFTPRIGAEVIVSFLEGDPDCPIIIGTVYNAKQTVPYTLPDNKTQSTMKTNSSKGGGGFNEIRFEDKKDSEEIFIHAQKDENTVVENDRTAEILNNDTITVTKNRTITVKEEHLTVKVETGNETHEVAGTRTFKVTGDETRTNEANHTWSVSGDMKLTVSGSLTIEVTGEVTIKGSKINLN